MYIKIAKTSVVKFSVLVLSLLFFTSSACSNGKCQFLETCSAASDCGPGLYCGNCAASGNNAPLCTRGQATIPTSLAVEPIATLISLGGTNLQPNDQKIILLVGRLPFNKYSWIVTHNAFSIVDAPSLTGAQRVTFYNQEDTVSNQLRNGVRGLMLDMYDFENDIWLCHSFHGQCYNITAFQPASNTLKEVEAFLTANPTEIVTIIIEDYVHSPKGLTKLFAAVGLDKYWFPINEMPKKGQDWPTVSDMVEKNHRLLVFTSDSSKETNEGIAYQWKYMVENEPGDGGVVAGSCPNRKESPPLNSKGSSLILQNYFTTIPVQTDACKLNSAPLADMVATCYKATGNRMPNFVAINFYMRSDGGGAFDILDRMNGQTLCGCSSITACEAGAPFGTCKTAPVSNGTMPTDTPGSFTGSVQVSALSSIIHVPIPLVFFFLSIISLVILL